MNPSFACVRRILVGSVILLSLAGCATASGEVEEPADKASEVENAQPRSLASDVSVSVTGDVSFEWEAETNLHVLAYNPAGGEVNLLNIGFADMHGLDGGRGMFRWSLDLVGEYEGAGTYEILATHGPEKVAGVGAGGGAVRSTAFVWYLALADGVEPHAPPYAEGELEEVKGFEHVYAACTLDIEEAETQGVLVCPDLRDPDGSRVSLEVSWESVDD